MKIQIVSQVRSGSTYLCKLFGLYTANTYNEPFLDYNKLEQSSIKSIWQRRFDALNIDSSFVIKSHYFQLEQMEQQLLNQIQEIDFDMTICLLRKDMFEQTLSHTIAQQSNVWSKPSDGLDKLTIDETSFKHNIDFRFADVSNCIENKLGIKYDHVIFYEDLTFDPAKDRLLFSLPSKEKYELPQTKFKDKQKQVTNYDALKDIYETHSMKYNLGQIDVTNLIANDGCYIPKIKQLIAKGASPQEMIDNTTTYCPHLWSQLHVDTGGNVRPCCVTNHKFKPIAHIDDKPISKIWKDDFAQRRKTLLNDQPLAECKSCYRAEQKYHTSNRITSIENYHNHVAPKILNDIQTEIINVDIRFSNLCNMRCRSCGFFASSKWYDDEIALKPNAPKPAARVINASQSNSDMIDQLTPNLTSLQEIYFAGGEPLIMDEHYILLDRLLDCGNTQLKLRYNSNGSKLKFKQYDVIDYWNKFDKVVCALSVDAMGKVGELVRKDTKWNEIEANAIRIKNDAPHVYLKISPTIQIYNMFAFTELHRSWIEKDIIGPGQLWMNNLQTPDMYNIGILPKVFKDKVAANLNQHMEWLTTEFCDDAIKDNLLIQGTIDFMYAQQTNLKSLRNMFIATDELDKLRNESTYDVIPELNELKQWYMENK